MPLCGARRRQEPGLCRNRAGFRTDHPGVGTCYLHAGDTRSGRAHAELIHVEQGARSVLERENLVPVDDPLHQLQLLAAEVVAWKNILGDKVEGLRGSTYDDLTETEQVRAVITAFERALDRCNTVLGGLVRLDLDERLAKVSAAQAAILIQLIEAVILDKKMALTNEQVQMAKAIVAREIPLISALPVAELGIG